MKTNFLKLGLALVAILAFSFGNAQTTTGDITQQGDATPNSTGTAVRVIDNKGTIKYLQVANGLTSFTNTTPNGGYITTWQLGGTLTSATTIDADGNAFTLAVGDDEFFVSGLEVVTTNTGYNVLIKDTTTNEVQEVALTDLLEVNGGQTTFVGVTDIAVGTAEAITGLPAELFKVSVYRNGAKLVAGVDYNVNITTGGELTLVDRSAAGVPAGWTLLTGDVIEVHWIN